MYVQKGPPCSWQTPADYSTAGLLEWIVYRGHSIGEQKHAKAKKSHVQRAGISVSTMTQQPLNLFNTHRLQPERVLCSSREPSTAKYLLCCSALIPNPVLWSARRCFSHGSGSSSWADRFHTSASKQTDHQTCNLTQDHVIHSSHLKCFFSIFSQVPDVLNNLFISYYWASKTFTAW